MPQQKYYAVHNGREGTQIYLTWDEAKVNVNRVSGVIYKSFRLPGEAQAWLQGIADAIPPRGPLTQQNPNQPVQRAPPATHAAAGPSQAGPSHVLEIDDDDDDLVEHDAMEVDDSSDIEILDGPPPHFAQASRARPSAYRQPAPPADDDDGSSDIEILEGPPPNFSRTASAARSPAPKQEEDRQRTPAVNLPQQAQVQAQAQAEMPNGAHAHDAEEDPAPTAPAGMLEAGPVRDFQLSPDQLYVLSKVKNGESVFFTGSAGTGKSVLLREIIKACGGRPSMKLAVTASTGIASVNIGGCTLHSWAGIQLGKEDKEVLVGKILGLERKAYKVDQERRKQLWARKARGEQLSGEDEAFLKTDPKDTAKSKYLKRWQQVKTLIIDEISMIDGKLFDKLEYIGRKLRGNGAPFGGIQLVLSGDFCQLPPVPDKSATGAQIPACFAFDAESWNRCVGAPIILRRVFRQKDQKFVDMLNAMRFGEMNEEITRAFRLLSRPVTYDDGILPTELYPKRADVERANSVRLSQLEGRPRNYRGTDAPGRDETGRELSPERVERALKDVIAPKDLPLKVGAQVMLLKNIIQGVLVNGSIGRVVGFYQPRDAVAMGAQIALPDNRDQGRNGGDETNGQAQQQPQQQGAQKNGHAPAPGGAAPEQDPQREQKLKAIMGLQSVWPAVQFQQGPLMLCVPLSFEVINADGDIEAVREQVPLILAWALSIHKSQGQTLERVKVDLSQIFEKGQAYVALSRATRMETLQVLNFDPAKVRAHPRVLDWMSQHMDTMPRLPYIPDDDVDEELEFWGEDL